MNKRGTRGRTQLESKEGNYLHHISSLAYSSGSQPEAPTPNQYQIERESIECECYQLLGAVASIPFHRVPGKPYLPLSIHHRL